MREWVDDAACANRLDVDWFDLDCGLEAAVQICRTCPVRQDCLNYAHEHDLTEGVWGGLWGDLLTKHLGRTKEGGR
jgi:hypothetical protein